MTAPVKLAGFAAALGVLFGGGTLAGAAIGPDRDAPAAAGRVAATDDPHGSPSAKHEAATVGTAGSAGTPGHGAPRPVRGLAVAENGLRLIVEDAELRRGRAENVRFRIVDNTGDTVRDFDVEHTKRMHLIVARRDLNGFQHLHPEQGADGSWTVELRLGEAGSYRLFADFSNRDEAYTLASDLRVDGEADLEPLPAATATSVSDGGYDVRLDAGRARRGAEADLRFTITKNGETVHPEPYLGAGGHLVALREGDLAFLHVHPVEASHGGEDTDEHDDRVGFAATFPTAGGYGLFLQFKHSGRVQTVAFTQEVE